MEWADTTEQAAFRTEVRAFIDERLPRHFRENYEPVGLETGDWQAEFVLGSDEARAAAREWMEALQERGWVAPHWPGEYGGAGLSSVEHFIFNQEMARAGAPPVGGQGVSMLGPTILVHGTDEQKARFLEPTLRGEMLWAQGFSEPGAGSDLASLQARADRDGDEYVINGEKLWTSRAHKSNWIFGLFRTDPAAPKHRGISFLVMDERTPGIEVRRIDSMGWEHATNETFYEDVRVPTDQLIGEENRGWYVAMTLLDFERSNIAGAELNRRRIVDLVEHLTSDEGRHHADRARAQRNAIADHYIASEVLFNFSLRIISMQAAGTVPNYEASTSKIIDSQLKQALSRTGVHVFGLYGNIWDADDPRAPLRALFTQEYVHSVVYTIFGGANEIQRNIIATRGLGLPRG
jgi:alkylation response protein AidB-like acyl-CoA dehydrogenase